MRLASLPVQRLLFDTLNQYYAMQPGTPARPGPSDHAVLAQPPRTIHQPRHLAPQPARVAKGDGPFQLLTRQDELAVQQHRGVHSQPWDGGRRVVGLGMARGDLRAEAAHSSIGWLSRHQLSAS